MADRREAPGPRPRLEFAADLATVVGATLYVLSYLEPALLLSGFAATGGDTASHFQTVEYLREALLPRGRLMGWAPGNLAGFPMFHLYFPLPFCLMVALAPFVGGLENGFNVVTAAGPILLPVCAYVACRALGLGFPAPALAAVSTLPFLLLESHSMWGGNLASMLAGEFSYSLGMCVLLLFVGTSCRDLAAGAGATRSAVLLAVMGLCHGYPLLLAIALSGFLVLAGRPLSRTVCFLAALHGLAFCLMGFWIVPLLAYSEYTTAYRDVWRIGSFWEVFPRVLWPWLLLLALLPLASLLARRRAGGAGAGLAVPIFVAGAAVAAGLYRVAYPLHLVDIRFLPFLQLFVVLLAAVSLARVVGAVRARALVPVIALLATVLWVDHHVTFTGEWVRWNYGGFEDKPAWPAVERISARLRGTAGDPRVAWEHSPRSRDTGSVRVFESLPRFAGRSTLEGVYMQASPNAPFVFYLQSEISQLTSCPFPDYHCARLAVDRAADHLRLYNASQVVVRSPTAREAFAGSPEYELEASEGPFQIFRLRQPAAGYVEPLVYEPLVVARESWKPLAYRWFKRAEYHDVVLVREGDDAPGRAATGASPPLTVLPPSPPKVLLGGGRVEATARVGEQEIHIRTSRPGHPLLVKVSYHPRWQLSDGGPVHQASPGFMLIRPAASEVTMRFGSPPLVRFGQVLTGLALLCVLLRRRFRRRPFADRLRALDPAGRFVRGAAIALIVAGLAAGLFPWRARTPDDRLRGALATYDAGDLPAAIEAFESIVDSAPSSSAALHATLHRGLALHGLERWSDAAEVLSYFVLDYPLHPERARALFFLAASQRAAGRDRQAISSFEALVSEFPATEWAQRARLEPGLAEGNEEKR